MSDFPNFIAWDREHSSSWFAKCRSDDFRVAPQPEVILLVVLVVIATLAICLIVGLNYRLFSTMPGAVVAVTSLAAFAACRIYKPDVLDQLREHAKIAATKHPLSVAKLCLGICLAGYWWPVDIVLVLLCTVGYVWLSAAIVERYIDWFASNACNDHAAAEYYRRWWAARNNSAGLSQEQCIRLIGQLSGVKQDGNIRSYALARNAIPLLEVNERYQTAVATHCLAFCLLALCFALFRLVDINNYLSLAFGVAIPWALPAVVAGRQPRTGLPKTDRSSLDRTTAIRLWFSPEPAGPYSQSERIVLVLLMYVATTVAMARPLAYLPIPFPRVSATADYLDIQPSDPEKEDKVQEFLAARPDNWILMSISSVLFAPRHGGWLHIIPLASACCMSIGFPLLVASLAISNLTYVVAEYAHLIMLANRECELGILRELRKDDPH